MNFPLARRMLPKVTVAGLTLSLLLGLVAQRILLDGIDRTTLAAWLFGAAALLAVLALSPRELPNVDSLPAPERRQPRRITLIAGVLVALAGLALTGWAGWRTFGDWLTISRTWPLYLAGIGLALAGFALWDDYRPLDAFRRWREWAQVNWVELLAILLILTLGFAVTLIGLHDFPPAGGISWNDEAQMGMAAYGILHHESLPWQFPTSTYPAAWAFNLLGNTTYALRLPFALMGSLVLIPFYCLTRRMSGPLPALAATILFAVSRYRIAFVRLVLPLTPDMLLAVITFACLARAIHTRGKAPYFLAGLALSLGMASHASFKVAPLLALLLLFIGAIRGLRGTLRQERSERRHALCRQVMAHLPGVLIFMVAFAVFTAPYAGIVSREPRLAVSERFTSVMPSLFASEGVGSSWKTLLPRARRVALFFNQRGEAWPAANLPELPALDPVTGVLFVLGLATSLIFFWRGWNLFAVAWFLLPIIGGGILTKDFRGHRFAIAMPAIYLLAGLFINQAWRRYRRAWEKRLTPFLVVLCLLLLVAGWINLGTFFGRQIHDVRARMEFQREISSVATTIAEFEGSRCTYLFANFPFYTPGHDFAWMAGEPGGRRAMDLASVLPSRDVTSLDIAYIFSWPYAGEGLAGAVTSIYPEAETRVVQNPYGKFSYHVVTVDKEDIDALRGLTARYWAGVEMSGSPEIERTEQGVHGEWSSTDLGLKPPLVVEWRGMLYVPTYGSYRLWLEGSDETELWLDERPALDGAMLLAEGWHQLRVTGIVRELPAAVRLLWRTPYGAREMVPAHMFSTTMSLQGILASFYPAGGLEAGADPIWQRMEPVIALQGVPTEWQRAPIPKLAGQEYSVVYDGAIRVEQSGMYEFRTVAQAGGAELRIDGEPVISDAGANWSSSYGEGVVSLSEGEHALRLEYHFQEGEFSGVSLHWTPPGKGSTLIPPEAFVVVGDRPLVAAPAFSETQPNPESAIIEPIQEHVAGSPLKFVGEFGGEGDGPGELREPWAIAGLPDGRLVVVDKGNRRLALFDRDGTFDSIWGKDDLVEPFDVAVGPQGLVYVLDSARSVIDVYDSTGRHVDVLAEGAGLFSPRGITIESDGTLYVADTGANRVMVFSSRGDLLRQIGRQGSDRGRFDQPGDVVIDAGGNLYVLDSVRNKRLVVLDPDGKPADEWRLNWAGDFITPGVAYGPASNALYMTDPDRGHVYHYDLDGRVSEIWGDEAFGSQRPLRATGLFIDETTGRFYVVDNSRHKVLIYELDN